MRSRASARRSVDRPATTAAGTVPDRPLALQRNGIAADRQGMPVDPHLTSVAATAAIGWTMVFAGHKKRMLETKWRRRRCPSCGLIIPGRTCERH